MQNRNAQEPGRLENTLGAEMAIKRLRQRSNLEDERAGVTALNGARMGAGGGSARETEADVTGVRHVGQKARGTVRQAAAGELLGQPGMYRASRAMGWHWVRSRQAERA